MGLFTRAGNAVRGAFIGATIDKSDGISWADQMKFFRDDKSKDGFKKLTTAEQLRVVRNNALVFACVTTKAQAFQQPPLAVETLNTSTDLWESSEDNELLEPYQNNPDLSESELKQYIAMHLDLTGKSFQWEWKDGTGLTREVWPIPPSWVTIKTVNQIKNAEDNRIISHYIIKPPDKHGEEFTILVDDMIYTRYPDPNNLWDGLSPVQAACRNIKLDNAAAEYKGEAIKNLNLPGVAVKTRKPLSPRQKDDLRAVLKQKLGGDARQNALLISGDDASIELLNPMKDFEWKNYSDLNETRVCMVFGVPPIVVGALVGLENSPWSNTGEAKRWMYQNTMVSMWKMVSTSLTRSLVPEALRKVMRVIFNLDDIKELRDDLDLVIKRALQTYNDGAATQNETREAIGLDSVPNGDFFKFRMNDVMVPVDAPLPKPLPDPTLTEDEQAAGVAAMQEENE